MDVERVQVEVEARFAAEQQNEDVMLRKIQAQVKKRQNTCLYVGLAQTPGVVVCSSGIVAFRASSSEENYIDSNRFGYVRTEAAIAFRRNLW